MDKPSIVIVLEPDAVLLDVEGILEKIAQAKYGLPNNPDDEAYNMTVEIDKMRGRDDLREAFHRGTLTAKNGDYFEESSVLAREMFDGVYIERSQFAQFANAEWFVTFVDIEQTAPVQAGDSAKDGAGVPLPDWKMKLQAEAAAMFKRLRKTGANPTVHSILDSLANWCVDNNVRTGTDIHPKASYLRTHVLSGKHWTPPPWED